MNRNIFNHKVKNRMLELERDIPANVVDVIIDMFIGQIYDELKSEGISKIEGLGTFKTKEVKEKKLVIKSPVAGKKQGKEITVKPYTKISFKDYKSSREKLK